jgi:hypothetical protein
MPLQRGYYYRRFREENPFTLDHDPSYSFDPQV